MAQSRDIGHRTLSPEGAMAREHKASMTCLLLASRMRFAPSLALNGTLKIPSRYWPIAIDPEGLTVRDYYFVVNNAG
jgi:hypothetical protein